MAVTNRPARSRARGAPRTQRLERGEGKERVFWEITRAKATLTTRFGRYLSEGRRIEKELASDAEAERAFDKMVADKRKEGYGDPPQKVEAGAASVKGVSVRNAELEALIDEQPTDPQGYLVYADWLQQQGDVRGELIVLQHGRSVDPDDAALERAETTLFKSFEEELLGPLARHTHIRTTYRSFKALSWRYGFVRAAKLRRITDTMTVSETLRMLLAHPSGRFLERLVLGRATYGTGPERDLGPVFEVLATSAPRTLDWVLVGDSAEVGNLAKLWEALPRLRHLVIAGWGVSLGDVRAEALEELIITRADRPLLEAVAGARWPVLKTLSLTVTESSESFAGAMAPLFASKGLPGLSQLTLRRWMTRAESELMPQDELAHDAVRFAATRRLERLELQMPMTVAGARAVLATARSLPPLRSIAIPTDAIASAEVRAAFAQQLPGIEWTDVPAEVAHGDLEGLAP